MKNLIFIISLLFLASFACETLVNRKDFVSITGRASEGKLFACVISKDKSIYYIDGLSFWPSAVRYKQVKVHGVLEVVERNESKSISPINGDTMTIIIPRYNILKQATYHVLE